MIRLLICLLGLVFSVTASSQVIYVSTSGNGSGASWAEATNDLQGALANATFGQEIWVAAGAYYPVVCDPCTEDQRMISFEIPDGVSLYGGFQGNETSLEQRDWQANLTVLSGDINQNNLQEDNAQTIVYFFHVSAQTVLDGFVIEKGYAVLEGAPVGERFNSGAAIYNNGVLAGVTSHPVIRNCNFSNNYAAGFGGAIYNNGAFGGSTNMNFENCIFSQNEALHGGGAIYNEGSFEGSIEQLFEDCTFTQNVSSWTGGGAIYNHGSQSGLTNIQFVNCHFEENLSTGHGGAILNIGRTGTSNSSFENCTFLSNNGSFGGGIANNGTLQGEANATILNCTFESNYASGDGGALYNWGSEGVSNAFINECIFKTNNTQFAGAGIFNNGIEGESKAVILNCQFIENISDTYGAAIYNNGKGGDASADIANCLFLKNSGSSAGAIYNLGSDGGNSSPTITNCTFYENSAYVGGAIYSNANDQSGTANPIVTNCIFWGNTAEFGAVFRNIESTTTVRYSVVDKNDCTALFSGTGAQVNCGEGMLFGVYPAFVDTTEENLRLSPSSPLLDIGYNEAVEELSIEFDLDHHSRIVNGVVDFGAYEYSSSTLPLVITTQPPGNITECEGAEIVLGFDVQGSGPYSYQWYKNGNSIPGELSQMLTLSQINSDASGSYYCIITNPFETITTNTSTLTVNPTLYAEVTLLASEDEICLGDEVTLSATHINGGAQPQFNWYRNNILMANNVTSISLSDIQNGDTFYVELISNAICISESEVTSTTLTINVISVAEPSVMISGVDEAICSGDSATINLVVENGGTLSAIQWYLNDALILENLSNLSTNNFNNGDQVYALIGTNQSCLSDSMFYSDTLTIAVNPVLEASVEINSIDSTLCEGDSISLGISYSNGGLSPSFEWLVNGNAVQFNSMNTLYVPNIQIGDQVTVIMNSSEQCILNDFVEDVIDLQVLDCSTVNDNEPIINPSIDFYPNPSSGELTVDLDDWSGECTFQIVDVSGKVIQSDVFTPDNINHSLILTLQETGTYFVIVQNAQQRSISKVIVQ